MRADESDILLALYRSAQENPAWAGFLRALAGRTGAASAYLAVQREGEWPQVFGAGAAPLDAEALQRMRYQRPYSGDDIAADQPYRAIRVRAEGGGDAWVLVARQGDDFASATSSLLSGLAPHIALAAVQFWRHDRAQAGRAAAQDMQARLGLSWVLLGAQATVILTSGAVPAAVLLADKLRLPPVVQRQLVQRLLAYAGGQTAAPLALMLGQRQALLVPFAQHGAMAMLYILDAKPAPDQPWPILAEIFALTPNEARFAAQLAGGKSIVQAGEALNFTTETARHYSKQLYAKLGAAGQVDVLRRIQNSVYKLL